MADGRTGDEGVESRGGDTGGPPFHFEIYRGPGESFGQEPKAIYYVENHNAQCGYGDLAVDFAMAAKALLGTYQDSQLDNWMAPVAHMVRQTLELCVKALLDSIHRREATVDAKSLGGHNILAIWEEAHRWLTEQGFRINEDARLPRTVHLLKSFHAIDPSGDLFRFGMSRKTAFNKRKSYDRVGLNTDVLAEDFEAAEALLSHWNAAVFRIKIAEEMGWESDPYFDVDDFPKQGGPKN